MPDPSPAIRRIPPDLEPLSDAEFEAAMDQFFDTRLVQPEKQIQRLLWTVVSERTRVGQLRHFVATAGENMTRPRAEAKVLSIAVSAATDLLIGTPEEFEKGLSLLEIAMTEVALSTAGKLDLDLSAWAARDMEVQQSKPLVRQFLGDNFHTLDDRTPLRAITFRPDNHVVNANGWIRNDVTFEADGEVEICGRVALELDHWGWSLTATAEGSNEPAVLAEGQEDTIMAAKEACLLAYQKHGGK